MRPLIAIASVALATCLASVARAQTPAPPDVAASALRALGLDQPNPLGSMLGQRPPFVVTEGDHVVVHMPIDIREPMPLFVADDITLRGRAIGDGRWWFDAATLPSTLSFGDATTAVSVKATLSTGGLDYHATFDPTHATENVQLASLPSLRAHVAIVDSTPPKPGEKAAGMPVEFDIDTGVLTTSERWTPAVAGFVRHTSDSGVGHLVVTMPALAPGARVTAGFIDDYDTSDVSPEESRAMTAAYNGFLVALRSMPDKAGSAKPADLPPAVLSQMRAMLAALRASLRSVANRTEADDIDVDLGDGTAPYHLDRLVVTGGGAASDGRLELLSGFELDGPRVPGLPAAYAKLLPSRILIRPRLGGMDIGDLTAAAGTMLDNLAGGEAAGEAAGRALFHKLASHGPLSVGLDTVAVDFDGASLVGSGAIRFASDDPSGVSATADLRVTGIDAVTAELAAHPETKDAIAPLAFLKGLGRQDGTVMTWHMDFSGGKLTVNGQDLTAMFSPPR